MYPDELDYSLDLLFFEQHKVAACVRIFREINITVSLTGKLILYEQERNMLSLFDQMNDIPRNGCKDIWNAFMLKGATFSPKTDIPICPSSDVIPRSLVSFDDAKCMYKSKKKYDLDFHVDAFVHFYIDDAKFDGKKNGIWQYPFEALDILRHFSGVITPDYSINLDFPEPWKIYNVYRMRCFGWWLHNQGIPVLNNVRWGTEETWSYCFDGIPKGSVVCVGAVASGLRMIINRSVFDAGFHEMIQRIQPRVIVVYGAPHYPLFAEYKRAGISIISFQSKTAIAYEKESGI